MYPLCAPGVGFRLGGTDCPGQAELFGPRTDVTYPAAGAGMTDALVG